MSKALPEASFVYEEGIVPDKKESGKTRHAERTESLSGLRSDLSKFYQLERKIRSINYGNAQGNAETLVDRLNSLLSKNGIGGKNGSEENRAYFALRGKDVVLVANTVVDGKEVSSRDKIAEAFSKIDAMLSDPFSKALTEFESRIDELNRDYQEGTNDVFRLMDTVVNLSGGRGGDRIYQGSIDSVRSVAAPTVAKFENFYLERMNALRPKIEAKTLSPAEMSELRVLESQKRRFSALMDSKLQSPEWVTKDVAVFLWETKGDMGRNAVEAVKGMAKGAFDAFFGGFILAYGLSTDPEVRKAMREAAGKAYDFCKENATDPEKFKDLFVATVAKEIDRVKKLPPKEQSNYIGQITGSVIASIAGIKLSKDLLTSNSLRIRTNADAAAELVAKKGIRKASDVRTWSDLEDYVMTIERVRMRESVDGGRLKKAIADIRTGRDSAAIKELPTAGGIRAKAEELIKSGGYVAEKGKFKKFTEDNLVDLGMEKARSANRLVREKFFPDSLVNRTESLGKDLSKIRKFHDFVDEKIITALRSKLSEFSAAAKEGSAKAAAATWQEARYQFELLKISIAPSPEGVLKFRAFIARADEIFPGISNAVEAASKSVDTLKYATVNVVADTKDQVGKILDFSKASYETWKRGALRAKDEASDLAKKPIFGNAQDVLPSHLRRNLAYEGGFAIHEQVTEGGGKMLRFVDSDGKFLKGPNGAILQFSEVSDFGRTGAVVRGKNGLYGVVGRDGNWIIDPKDGYHSIKDLGDNRKVVQLSNGRYRVLEAESVKSATGSGISFKTVAEYDFITEPQEGRAIGLQRRFAPDGSSKMIRHVLKDEGDAKKRLRYEHIDHFTDDGFAAALRKRGKNGEKEWVIINRDGEKVPWSQSIKADDPASALNVFRERQSVLSSKSESTHFVRHKDIISERLAKEGIAGADKIRILPTGVDGFYVLEKKVDGKMLKGFFNVRTKKFIEPEFNAVFSDDARHGFVRVKNAEGKWGVVNAEKGGYFIEPKGDSAYSSLQILDSRVGLFETEVKVLGKNGEMVERRGMIGLNGKEYIKPEYEHIHSPREGLYRGVTYDSGDYSRFSSISREFDASKLRSTESGKLGDHAFSSGVRQDAANDPLSTAVNVGLFGKDVKKVSQEGTNVYYLNGSPALQALKQFWEAGFYRAESTLFGKGAKGFAEFLSERAGVEGGISSSRLLAIFDEYSAKRMADFIREYSKDGTHFVTKNEMNAIERNYVLPVRRRLEERAANGTAVFEPLETLIPLFKSYGSPNGNPMEKRRMVVNAR